MVIVVHTVFSCATNFLNGRKCIFCGSFKTTKTARSYVKCMRCGKQKSLNGHVRRVLVEAAWTYRHPVRKTAVLQRRAEQTSEAVQEIAWKAQTRLCGRYRLFEARGKLKVQACTSIARELAGFIWAIGQALPQPTANA